MHRAVSFTFWRRHLLLEDNNVRLQPRKLCLSPAAAMGNDRTGGGAVGVMNTHNNESARHRCSMMQQGEAAGVKKRTQQRDARFSLIR